MTRAAALIVKDGHVALIERRRGEDLFYLFPGGQVEPGEPPEEAVVREVREKLGLDVCVERLVADIVVEGTNQLYYLACITDGESGTGNGPWVRNNQVEAWNCAPIWMSCRGLSTLPLYPREVALLVEFSGNGWPHDVLRLTDRSRERRAMVPVI